jgi:hypothetical protein
VAFAFGGGGGGGSSGGARSVGSYARSRVSLT